ncbi:MAG TPA: COX15/CtaA family protein [Thermoanaerobaculia bacterium]|jgi:heme A synthase|nr:COX15/CtaA family protein [Thermoanaerobaculia bacterium]
MDRLARYSWFTLGCNIAVILWGAFVRATGSGAGCGSHWPLCNGEVIPESPGTKMLVELTHRVTSGMALLLVVGLVVLAWRQRPKGHPARRAAALSMVLMLTEAAVGAGLVLFELVADNKSMARAMFMGVHLMNTFFLLGFLTLTAHFASGGAAYRWRGRAAVGAGLGMAALIAAGVSGAVAALGDTLFPATSLAEALRQDLSASSHLLIRLRLLHPVISATAGVIVGLLAARVLVSRPELTRPAKRVVILVFLQVVAGVTNVILLAPVWMQIIHLLLADLLWISAVLLGAQSLSVESAIEWLPHERSLTYGGPGPDFGSGSGLEPGAAHAVHAAPRRVGVDERPADPGAQRRP